MAIPAASHRPGADHPVPSLPVRPVEAAVTVVACGLLVLTGFAGWIVLGATVALGGFLVAWGWPGLLASPSPRGAGLVIAVSTVLLVGSVFSADADPFLRYVPVALALSVLLMFLQQLLRRDGRPRLTTALAVSASGILVVASGAGLVPLPNAYGGIESLAIAGAAMAAAAPVDLLGGRGPLRPWLLPLSMVVGAAAGLVVGAVTGAGATAAAALVGLLSAGVSHSLRRLLAGQPQVATTRGQLTVACASVLVPGLVIYTLARILMA